LPRFDRKSPPIGEIDPEAREPEADGEGRERRDARTKDTLQPVFDLERHGWLTPEIAVTSLKQKSP
jgi:hypothetical protein